MPELPEVESLCRQLELVAVGKRIKEIFILDPKLGSPPDIGRRRIAGIQRRAKNILLALDDGRAIRIHLRMTGRLLWQAGAREHATPRHSRLIITFGKGRLLLIDPRRFAIFEVAQLKTEELPPDALDKFPAQWLSEIAARREISVKSFLMDQRIISGIGNIYACEILHAAKINPARKAKELSAAEWRRILKAGPAILSQAVMCRGTTVSDWRDLFGNPGEYQHHLKVYAKSGARCPRCGQSISRVKLDGRGTYLCAHCQK